MATISRFYCKNKGGIASKNIEINSKFWRKYCHKIDVNFLQCWLTVYKTAV